MYLSLVNLVSASLLNRSCLPLFVFRCVSYYNSAACAVVNSYEHVFFFIFKVECRSAWLSLLLCHWFYGTLFSAFKASTAYVNDDEDKDKDAQAYTSTSLNFSPSASGMISRTQPGQSRYCQTDFPLCV